MIVYSTSSGSLPRVGIYGIGSAADTLPAPRLVPAAQSAEYRAAATRRAHYVGRAWQHWRAATLARLPVPQSAAPAFEPWQAECLEAVRWLRRWRAYDALQAPHAPPPAPLSRSPIDTACQCHQCNLSAA